VWRASRGHRWILAAAGLTIVTSVMLVPDMSIVGRPLEAIALAVGRAAIGGIASFLGLCVSVTAWKLAIRQEPTLAPTDM